MIAVLVSEGGGGELEARRGPRHAGFLWQRQLFIMRRRGRPPRLLIFKKLARVFIQQALITKSSCFSLYVLLKTA